MHQVRQHVLQHVHHRQELVVIEIGIVHLQQHTQHQVVVRNEQLVIQQHIH